MNGACVVDHAPALLACTGQDDGDLLVGRGWFEEAYQKGEQAGDERMMAEAVLGLCGLWVHEHRTAAASGVIEARLRHVRSLIDPANTLALRLRVRAAAEADYRRGEHTAILAGLVVARTAAEPIVRMEALSLAHHCLLGPDHGSQRRALADELIGEAARAGHRGFLLMGLLWLVADMFLDADPHAERRLRELRAMLAEQEHPAIGFVVHAMQVMLAIRAGRLAEAEQLAHECREHGVRAGDADADGWYGAQLVAIRWYQGRLPELLPMLKELINSPTLSAVDNSFLAAYAVAAAHGADYRTAAAALATLSGRSLTELPRSSSWLVTMYGVVEAAHLLGNAPASARAYELLQPFTELPMTASLAVACFGSVHHALGVASVTTGHLDRAVAHLCEAVHRNLALGHWPAVIASRLRYAEALECRGAPGDEAAAAEQRAEARAVAATIAEVVQPAPSGSAIITRHGAKWRVEVGTRSALVDHSVGMLHLAVLTANPAVEVTAIDLAGGVEALRHAAGKGGMPAQQVLDRAAIHQYRLRLSRLREEIDELECNGDHDRAARAHAERDWLLAELGANAGLGGRRRAFSDDKERARLAVGRAIRRTLTRIERADAIIGAHLRAAVHTGAHCCYRPI